MGKDTKLYILDVKGWCEKTRSYIFFRR